MSTVLWANVLVGDEVRSEEADRHALYRHARKLDDICRTLGLPEFQSMCDTTDLRYNTDDAFELPEGMTSTNELMARQGVWTDAATAIGHLRRLVAHLREKKVRFGLLSNDHDAVVGELDEVIAFLASRGDGATRFNFSVVM